MPPRRLDRHPLTSLDRGAATTLRHEGRTVPGFEREPIAVALYADGRRVLSRSMRYHRARGYFCGTGACTHCFLRVDGQPNVRSCLAACGAGRWSEGQNAYPSVEHDLLAGADLAFPNYIDAHHAFIRPAVLKPLYTRIIRGMAGFGRVPTEPVAQRFDRQRVQADVCVAGAGPAGLAAAEAAASEGAKVLLLERADRVGGRLRWMPTPFHATAPEAPRVEGKVYADDAATRLRLAGVEVHTGARLFGIYGGNRLAASTPTRLLDIHCSKVVLATGSHDGYVPVPGGDRAGVLLVGGALRLLNEHGVLPGEDVAIVGVNRDSLLLARDLLACGARIAAFADPRLPQKEGPLDADLRRMGMAVQWSTRVHSIVGRKGVTGIKLERGRTRRVDCDAAVIAGPRQPTLELAQQAGCAIGFADQRFRVKTDADGATTVDGVFAAGSLAGTVDAWQSVLAGRRVGRAAARAKAVLA